MADDLWDVLVIGAGIEGSASAYTAAKRGNKTLLIEQFILPHSRGSSHGATRITRKMYDHDVFVAMMKEAYPLWSKLEKENDTQLYKETGIVGFDGEPYTTLKSNIASFKKHSLPYKELSSDQLKRDYPMLRLSPDVTGFFDASGGTLKANKALVCYQSMFKKFGGLLRDGEKVMDISPGHIVTVKTNKGQYRTKSLIITSGAWANNLLRPLQFNLPLNPLSINVCYWRVKDGEKSFPHAFISHVPTPWRHVTGETACHIYGLPADEYPNCVKICLHSGYEINPDERDANSQTGDIEVLQKFVRQQFPTLEDKPCIVERCIYTLTPDHNPVLDHHPRWKNIIVGAGFSGHGFKLAPVVGKVLTELALNEVPSYDLTLFKAIRFQLKASL